jgi:hypothetical protein
VARELFPPTQEIQFDHEAQRGNLATQLLDQFCGGRSGSTGREHIVDQQHILTRLDRVLVNFDDVGAILKLVFDWLSSTTKMR